LLGAIKDTVADALPALALTPVGAPGAVGIGGWVTVPLRFTVPVTVAVAVDVVHVTAAVCVAGVNEVGANRTAKFPVAPASRVIAPNAGSNLYAAPFAPSIEQSLMMIDPLFTEAAAITTFCVALFAPTAVDANVKVVDVRAAVIAVTGLTVVVSG